MDKTRYDIDTIRLMDRALEQQMALDPESRDTLVKILDIAEKKDDDGLRGFAYYYLANVYYTIEMDYQQYRDYLGKAIRYLALANDFELLTRAYNFVGVDASNNGSYDISYYYYMMALRTCEDLGSDYLLSIVNSNIGQLYARLGDYERGRQYIRKGINKGIENGEDLYYYHNIMNGLVLDGTVSIKLGDIDSAIKRDVEIQEMMEQFTGQEGINEVGLSAAFFRTQVALLKGDDEEFEKLLKVTLDELKTGILIFDFVEDIYDFCLFFLEHDKKEPVKQILEDLSGHVENSGVNHMKRLFADLEIRYWEAVGNEEKANSILRKIHLLSDEQKIEQNKLYMYSMQLIDTMDEVRRESRRMKKENEILQHQAMTDALTQMPNRLAMVITLNEVIQRALEEDKSVAVEMLDIDLFKEYNDNYGHSTGDRCLRAAAAVMMEIAERPGIHCARYGGDEFVFIYEGMNETQIMDTARELSEKIADLKIERSDSPDITRITISQGICIGKPDKDRNPGDFLETADSALYDVKRSAGTRKQGVSIRMI